MAILVTGGTGYIGSHMAVVLLEHGENVIILDSLINSSVESLHRIEQITGRRPLFYQGDVRDADCLKQIFKHHHISTVLHFAGLKAVAESVCKPLDYYHTNVAGTVTLLNAMMQANVHQFIFSSSATVYGTDSPVPYVEHSPVGQTTNPYARSKLMVEQLLQDVASAQPQYSIISLRYFNPIGAHPSGLLGEKPTGYPNNLLPYMTQVAIGRLQQLGVFGSDYPTEDGTGVRDYIHIMDLVDGHLAAMNHLKKSVGFKPYNLGTGIGYSVLEMIQAFEEASGVMIPYQMLPRRAGDLAAFWADTRLAKKELGWEATRNIHEMMRDTWNWQKKGI